MKKIAIIGAGIFGCSTAIELQKNGFETHLFDRSDDILNGASTVNQLRHHYGFHYPRSKETVEEIKKARVGFESKYGDAISKPFDNFYAIALNNSKTTPKDFIRFCDEMKLPYDIEWPENTHLDRSKVGICIKTAERVYDPAILRGIIHKEIKDSGVKLFLNHKLIDGEITHNKKHLNFKICNRLDYDDTFDCVVNAIYANFNDFDRIFNFEEKKLNYDLIELIEIYIPTVKKFGLTILDGDFFTLLPRGERNTFTLGNVRKSILKSINSNKLDAFDISQKNKKTVRNVILEKASEFCPIIKQAEVVQSLYVTRALKSNVESTDKRPSEITSYGNGIYSIFGGKVITSVDIAKEITEMIKAE